MSTYSSLKCDLLTVTRAEVNFLHPNQLESGFRCVWVVEDGWGWASWMMRRVDTRVESKKTGLLLLLVRWGGLYVFHISTGFRLSPHSHGVGNGKESKSTYRLGLEFPIWWYQYYVSTVSYMEPWGGLYLQYLQTEEGWGSRVKFQTAVDLDQSFVDQSKGSYTLLMCQATKLP